MGRGRRGDCWFAVVGVVVVLLCFLFAVVVWVEYFFNNLKCIAFRCTILKYECTHV